MAPTEAFIPAFGNRPDALVGREDVISAFREGLDGSPGNRNRAMMLIGQRGMGKTALLMEMADVAEASEFVTASVLADERMLDEAIHLIQIKGARYVKGRAKGVKSVNASALGFSVGLTFSDNVAKNHGFRIKLSLLCDELAKAGRGVLILVDEVQAGTSEMRELAAAYQHLVGERKNIAIVMAGLPSAISDVLNDDILTFLNRAYKQEIGPLSLSEISVYYASVFHRRGKQINAKLLESAVLATRGYPYLLQLIGYYLLKYTAGAKRIKEEVVELSIHSAKRDLIESIYKPALKPLSEKDLAFLRAMSEDETSSAIADVRQRLGESQAMAQQYRARLIASGVIAPTGRGKLEYTLPYLREYLSGEL
jgi:hypothetical protein